MKRVLRGVAVVAILGVTNPDRDATFHAVKYNAEAIFTWD